MTELILATSNSGKIKEFEKLLQPTIKIFTPPQIPNVEENGNSYQENARKKATAFFHQFQRPVLSDDSGLEIDALGGAPGIFSARFGGEQLSWPQRWEYLFEKLKRFPEKQWTCLFRAVLCYFDGGTPMFFEGTTRGRIVSAPNGTHGFGYDPIFYSEILKKTFGEATFLEKQTISHRAIAVQAFLEWWKTRPNS